MFSIYKLVISFSNNVTVEVYAQKNTQWLHSHSVNFPVQSDVYCIRHFFIAATEYLKTSKFRKGSL